MKLRTRKFMSGLLSLVMGISIFATYPVTGYATEVPDQLESAEEQATATDAEPEAYARNLNHGVLSSNSLTNKRKEVRRYE